MTRELDDLILDLRTNEPELGTWVLRTTGDPERVLAHDRLLCDSDNPNDWLASEITGYLKRTLKRLDVTSRSLIALIEPGSCFAGSLLELGAGRRPLVPAGRDERGGRPGRRARRGHHRPDEPGPAPDGQRPDPAADALPGRRPGPGRGRAAGRQTTASRRRRAARPGHLRPGRHRLGRRGAHRDRGTRQLQPGRPVRPGGELPVRRPETLETKIFGRLSAWQNWIFTRPNASGPDGALRKFGTGQRADFDRKRV